MMMTPRVVVLILLSLLPLAAHADAIDDFSLTGGGLVLSYSLPATSSYPDFSLFNFFSESALTTINGASGNTVVGAYYDTSIYPYVSLELSFPIATGRTPLILLGAPFINFSFVSATNPPPYLQSDVVPTFVPGIYTLYQTTSNGPVAYTLDISPETSAAPEPSTFILLATGALGMLGIAAGRARPASAHRIRRPL